MKNRILTIIIGFIVPFCAVTVCFPLYNRIEPFVLGFSFNYFWIFTWMFLTSLCLLIAFWILLTEKTPESWKQRKWTK